MIAFAVSGCGEGRSTEPAVVPTPPVPVDRYSWISSGQFTVRVGDRTIGPAVGSFAEASHLFWTASGDFTVAVSINKDREGSLVVADTRAGVSRRITCGCTRAEPVGGNRLVYVDGQNALRVHDLDLNTAPAAIPLSLPDGLRAVEVVAASGDDLLVRSRKADAGTGDASGIDVIQLIRAGRPVREVTTNAQIVGSSAIGGLDRDGNPTFLISQPADDGVCPEQLVSTYQPHGAGLTRVSFATGPAKSHKNVITHLGDSWWDQEGRLNSMLAVSACIDGIHEAPSLSTWWRWDGTTWSQVETEPMLAIRTLTSGSRIELVQDDDIQVLYHQAAGSRTTVAPEVLAVAAPPA
jgi:hypothetical protein